MIRTIMFRPDNSVSQPTLFTGTKDYCDWLFP